MMNTVLFCPLSFACCTVYGIGCILVKRFSHAALGYGTNGLCKRAGLLGNIRGGLGFLNVQG